MISVSKITVFIKRERIYIFLLVFVILIHALFSFLNRILEDSGLDKIFEQKRLDGEEIISGEKIEEIINSNPIISFIFFFLFVGFIIFVVIGIASDIIYLYLRHKNKIPFVKTQIAEAGKWDFWDICKVAIIFLFAQNIIWLIDIFVFSGIPYLQARASLKLMLSATAVDIIGVAAVLYFVLNERRQDITSLGLTAKRFFANIKYGICAYIGLIPPLAAVMFLTVYLFNVFKIPIEPQPILVILKKESHVPSLVYMCLFTGILGPCMEEIFFRGFAYSVFKRGLGIFGGIIASAAFFAYVHANMASFLPILCLGVLLAYLYEKTGSLVPSIIVHIIHNSTSLIFLLFIKAITA